MKLFVHSANAPIYVVYPKEVTTHEFEQAEMLSRRIDALTGIRPMLTHGADLPANAYVIFVGRVPCGESAKVLSGLNYGQGEISFVSDNRLVITSHTEETLPMLVSYLLGHMSADDDGNIVFDDAANGYRTNGMRYMHHVPVFDGVNLINSRRSDDGCDMLVVSPTDIGGYDLYIKKLLENNFSLIYQRTANGNVFTRLKNDEVALQVYFTPYNKYTRIVIEPVTNMFALDKEPLPKVCEPQMTLIGRRFSTTSRYLGADAGAGLMCYVIRLSDSRFIVIDGGVPNDCFGDAIWNTMRDQAKDKENIVIAAWFITHTHADHIGGYINFANRYADKVKLQRLIYNFPSIEDADCIREGWNIRQCRELMYEKFPGAVFCKPHTGELFQLGDAEIEILYTQEDMIRHRLLGLTILGREYNCSSMAFRVTLGGTTMMFPGDTEDEANNIISAMYGKHLKSDILQVCHHGGRGGTIEFYKFVDPDVAIFSTSDTLLKKYLALEYNYSLVYNQNVKEVYNSFENTVVFKLPYTAKGNDIPKFTGKRTYKRAKYLESLAAVEMDDGIEL